MYHGSSRLTLQWSLFEGKGVFQADDSHTSSGRPQMPFDPTSFDALIRFLTGLSVYTILSAEDTCGGLEVSVVAAATSALCPSCGDFSTAVKSVREQLVRDVPHAGRRVMLTVAKRSFRVHRRGL